MPAKYTNHARIAALALIITVATQIIYITISMTGGEPDRQIIWSAEVLAFVVMSIAGFALLPARPVIGAAIAVGGLLNVIQAGMGLVMFPPLSDAGEALEPAFTAVLQMAFLLFYAGKIAIGVGAIAIARELWSAGGMAKIVGGLSGIAGLVAIALNTGAITLGSHLMFAAGAAGTAAALFLALAITALHPVAAE